jgi:hypothetical protein
MSDLRITLTEKQVRDLLPYFDRVQAAAALGSPGMLIAQIHWDLQSQRYWMTPAFLPHEHAKLITEKGERAPALSDAETDARIRAGMRELAGEGEPHA